MWTDVLNRPIVIAHRGDKANAPENTLSAFKLAVEKGADAIEFDVKLTADGQIVVIHDQSVNRTTNGTGKLSNFTLTDLRSLDAGAWFSEDFHGERIPTLDDVFETVGKHINMNVELTNYATPDDNLVPKVIKSVTKHGLQTRVLFSSFLVRNLTKTRLLMPEVPRGLLCRPGLAGLWARTFAWRGDYFAIHPNLADVTPELVKRTHLAGKRVHVWTVNTGMDIKKMIDMEVDAIFTHDPGMALGILGRSG